MRFSDLIRDTKVLSTNITNFDFCVKHITSDSKKISFGDVFIARPGTKYDGHSFIKEAYLNGARAVICERVTKELKDNSAIRYIKVEDSAAAEAKMLNIAFGEPAKNMRLMAVTGTNGKTTTAYMLKAILDKAGHKTGIIGTVKTLAGDTDITQKSNITSVSPMTTPSPEELFSSLYKMRELGVDTVVLEASSHALMQKRLDGLHFDIGIFTNLTEDHLDYHKTLSEYRNAKAHLFELCDKALINTDCDDGKIIASGCKCPVYTYGKAEDADFRAENTGRESGHTEYELVTKVKKAQISCPIPGEFTVYNTLAAISASILAYVDVKTAADAVKNLSQIPGRLERIDTPDGINLYIDYAHTPDALENVLKVLKGNGDSRLITVFGCGGDREREKRPIMGRIATNISDFTIVTEDNSRSEDTDSIIADISAGIASNNFVIIKDRRKAIFFALETATNGDTVLLAGKGHEDYTIIGKEKRHFSEKEVIKEYYKEKYKKNI